MLRVGFLVVVLVGAGYWIYRERVGIAAAMTRVSAPAVLLAFAAATAAMWVGAPAWRTILQGLGSELPRREAWRIYFVGQLGKYIPGGVWTAAAHATMGRELSVPRSRTAAATLLSIGMTVVTAGLLGGFLLLLSSPDSLARYWWVVPLLVPLVAFLHPSVLVRAARLAGTVIKRPMSMERLPGRRLWEAAAWFTLGHVANGLGLYALLASIGGVRPPVVLVIGLLALATAAGLLVVFAPAGAGVREAIVVFGLAAYVDAGSALLVVILARLANIAGDFALAAVFGRSGARPQRGAAEGAG